MIRYTLTYTPSRDRILPSPTHLHVRIKNTSPIALRAAFVHGPYSLHVSAYPSTFNPHKKNDDASETALPEFEPLLKAGAHWTCKLILPESIRETGEGLVGGRRASHDSKSSQQSKPKSVTWIIEVASQILFSSHAAVHYDLLVGRDERSLSLGFSTVASHGQGGPGRIQDHAPDSPKPSGPIKGVYSRAISLIVEDTEALWDKPKLPSTEGQSSKFKLGDIDDTDKAQADTKHNDKPKRKIHLVVLSHGIHSNLGADMLFLKESIDATVRQANAERKQRRKAARDASRKTHTPSAPTGTSEAQQATATAPLSGGQETDQDHGTEDSDDEDQETTIVRGFSGNAIKTEKGIQYLGKRLAKYVLQFTYPDQPFRPMKKSKSFADRFKDDKPSDCPPSVHNGSHIHRDAESRPSLPFTFTSISFIGHSLGGLIQTYAIAYIQKHAPDFFTQVKPINFICLASPLLGLSNENPMYVKFALDFGLVGRTGQDLGLTWRAPTLAKSGWSAVMGGLTPGSKDNSNQNPNAKPLLRILPTGPAHQVLKLFRNRTVYSNVVNDGIVPLRTSCLLFLDWKGLGKVDKARRENGLIGTVAEWGWAELTGATAADPGFPLKLRLGNAINSSSANVPTEEDKVPQPPSETIANDARDSSIVEPSSEQFLQVQRLRTSETGNAVTPTPSPVAQSTNSQTSSVFDNIIDFFRPTSSSRNPKTTRAMRRGQTLKNDNQSSSETSKSMDGVSDDEASKTSRPTATRGDSLDGQFASAPPKTSIFEAASDILYPPLPSQAWITDPSVRKQTIFHDRVYHPEDIPPPPLRSMRTGRSFSTDATATLSRATSFNQSPTGPEPDIDYSRMKVEERIARAYHRDLSWRKVLVSLEPDAHNNMIVRRMFANAYGWPVVKHLCDTHFADTWAASTRDEHEPAVDRAAQTSGDTNAVGPKTDGTEVMGQAAKSPPRRKSSDMRSSPDELSHSDLSLSNKRSRVQEQQASYTQPRPSTATTPSTTHLSTNATLRISPDTATARDASGSEALHSPNQNDDSEVWDDAYFEGTEDDDDEEEGFTSTVSRIFGSAAQRADAALRGVGSPSSPNATVSSSASAQSPLHNAAGSPSVSGGSGGTSSALGLGSASAALSGADSPTTVNRNHHRGLGHVGHVATDKSTGHDAVIDGAVAVPSAVHGSPGAK